MDATHYFTRVLCRTTRNVTEVWDYTEEGEEEVTSRSHEEWAFDIAKPIHWENRRGENVAIYQITVRVSDSLSDSRFWTSQVVEMLGSRFDGDVDIRYSQANLDDKGRTSLHGYSSTARTWFDLKGIDENALRELVEACAVVSGIPLNVTENKED